jgi:hypothetical protein
VLALDCAELLRVLPAAKRQRIEASESVGS